MIHKNIEFFLLNVIIYYIENKIKNKALITTTKNTDCLHSCTITFPRTYSKTETKIPDEGSTIFSRTHDILFHTVRKFYFHVTRSKSQLSSTYYPLYFLQASYYYLFLIFQLCCKHISLPLSLFNFNLLILNFSSNFLKSFQFYFCPQKYLQLFILYSSFYHII